MTVSQWATYCLAVFMGGIIPGPVMLLALAYGARQGVISALPAAFGNISASVVQVLMSIFLFRTISQFSEPLVQLMTGCGGLYLIYLSFGLFRRNPFERTSNAEVVANFTPVRDFVDMFMLTMMNPKALLFFISLFPLVIPESGYSTMLVVMMTAVFALIALFCFLLYASAGKKIKLRVAENKWARIINYSVVTTFLLLGLTGLVKSFLI